MKEGETDLGQVWPAVHRSMPLLRPQLPPNEMRNFSATKSLSVRLTDLDKPHPWRYVRWRKAHERQARPGAGKIERPKGNYVYKVIPGENLNDIAMKHDTFTEVLMEANTILNPDNVAIGQLLWIPRTHLIKRGNTLWSLSRKFGVSIPTIQEANGIEDPNLIYAGDVIVIPEELDR